MPPFVKRQPVSQTHCDKPFLPVAAVEYCWRSIVETLGIVNGLLHPLGQPQMLGPLDFAVNALDAGYVRLSPIIERRPWRRRYAVRLEYLGKLYLGGSAFCLLALARKKHLPTLCRWYRCNR